MSKGSRMKGGLIAVLLATTGLAGAAQPAFADDYMDLLSILRTKGSLTQSEYDTLAARHGRNAAAPRTARRTQPARMQREGTPEPAADDVAAARQAAASAAASAAAAQAAMQTTQAAMAAPDVVHAMPYTPGKGITVRAGAVDLNFSGFVNGFYTYSSAGHGPRSSVAGGVADASGFDSSSIRNGLLPAALIFKASTTQAGIDLAAVFGVYPGIDSSKNGALNANSGGNPVGLGTAGVDFRQVYVTAGTKEAGTFKVGRDLGIFGSDAILSDQTLLGVGATGSNANPGNTSLGRIGIGYIYADFMPQISYASPIFGGVQATVGVFQPLDSLNASGLSGSSIAHDTPMFQGKLTYDWKGGNFAGRLWSSFLVQPQQGISGTLTTTTSRDRLAAAVDMGAKLDYGPFGFVGTYYRGEGVGTTGLFFDSLAQNGRNRASEGFYVQGSVKPIPKLKLVASYGESSLYLASGEFNPTLVRRNESEVGGAYYSLTDWMTLVGEYAHVDSHAHGPNQAHSNSFTGGTILFF